MTRTLTLLAAAGALMGAACGAELDATLSVDVAGTTQTMHLRGRLDELTTSSRALSPRAAGFEAAYAEAFREVVSEVGAKAPGALRRDLLVDGLPAAGGLLVGVALLTWLALRRRRPRADGRPPTWGAAFGLAAVVAALGAVFVLMDPPAVEPPASITPPVATASGR